MPLRPLVYVPIEAGCAHLAFWPVYLLGRKGKTTILKSLGSAFKGGGTAECPSSGSTSSLRGRFGRRGLVIGWELEHLLPTCLIADGVLVKGGGSSMWANAHSSPLNGVNGISYHRSLNS